MSDFTILQPSTNPLGSPVISNSPVNSLIQTNDAEVKIPELGKKREVHVIKPHQKLDHNYPRFSSTFFIPIASGYPRPRKRQTSPGRVAVHPPPKLPKF